ncbi:tail protein X [Bartonella schoenbuchensis]|uniref:Phage tail protein n=2 Tax=Bartonella schoenbuchensis TaxID=165694 RepID=E6Z109_BARSR|nr:tail protein X [Bartonella schoenbuchensis]AQX31191.1 P2-like prophage tail protein X [Bartonella schoenbuchensis R1]ENN91093.1 phage tail protein X [Bartonella schoenbuchensis m07a]CBI82797.1 phage tail protein [Bartonella schoenbuchensis R1]
MSDIYVTKNGDMVDAICWKHYPKGQQALAVERVYTANHRLADLGPILKAGVTIVLPALPYPQATPVIRLWGSK